MTAENETDPSMTTERLAALYRHILALPADVLAGVRPPAATVGVYETATSHYAKIRTPPHVEPRVQSTYAFPKSMPCSRVRACLFADQFRRTWSARVLIRVNLPLDALPSALERALVGAVPAHRPRFELAPAARSRGAET